MNVPSVLLAAVFLFVVGSSGLKGEDKNDLSGIATQILDENKTAIDRDGLIAAHSGKSAALIFALVQSLAIGTPDEYRGIPSIWKVAIAAGKRNNDVEIKQILSVALPQPAEPLRDWQAVVIGGGIINGLSLNRIWPQARIEKILQNDNSLQTRWSHSLKLASVMADNETVRPGTRYDALRMLGVAPWKSHGAQLTKYLGKNIHGELQQGAVCGIADIDSPAATDALIKNFHNFTKGNQQFALDALLRSDARINQLLNAVAEGRIEFSMLGTQRLEKLKKSPNEKVRQRIDALEKLQGKN